MNPETTPSGIAAVGDLRWGDHFCQFYETAEDLRDSLVPYFKAGLENHEKCLWVTSAPFRTEDATSALRAAMPGVDDLLRSGQIEILGHEDWYLRQGDLSPAEVIKGWTSRTDQALASGFRGLRLTGNTFFVDAPNWSDFEAYEEAVNAAFRSQHIVALCSYCFSRCEPSWIVDVVRNHQFALVRRKGRWEVVENASVKTAKAELARLNAELEQRVDERTAALRAALADKDVLFREVHHRVKNNLQVIASLVSMRARNAADPAVVSTLTEVRNRVKAMALVHEQLYRQEQAAIDFADYLGALCEDLRASYGAERVTIEVDASHDTIPLETAIPLGMAVTELVSNALKHAFPADRPGRIKIAFRTTPALSLVVGDTGIGLPAEPSKAGGGLDIVRALAGQLDMKLDVTRDSGTVVRLAGAAAHGHVHGPGCCHGA